jgi:autoinducer-2 kinase
VSTPVVLAVDAGNSGCRAAVVRADGRVVSIAAREWRRDASGDHPGTIELDLEAEWSLISTAIAEAIAGAPKSAVASICVSAARSGLVVLDETTTPVAAFGPLDQRAATQASARVSTEPGWPARLLSHTGQSVAIAAGPRLAWLREQRPRVAENVTVLTLAGWLVHRLTGEAVAEPTNASTIGLLDLGSGRWWEEEQRRWEIPPTVLPPIVQPYSLAGTLRPEVAAATGLPAGTRVAVGGGDTQLALLALGATRPGTTGVIAGSFWQVARAIDRPMTDPTGRLRTTAHAARERWLVEARVGAPGLAARWLRDTRVGAQAVDGYDQLVAAAAAVPIGSRGVVAVLAPSGGDAMEAPVEFDDVAGSAGQDRGVAFRALLEATASEVFGDMEQLDRIARPSGDAVLVGGGAIRNALWLQILADAIQRPVRPSAMPDQSLLGAAMIATVAAGIHASIEAASRAMQHWAAEIEPDPTLSAQYEEVRANWRQAVARRRERSASASCSYLRARRRENRQCT